MSKSSPHDLAYSQDLNTWISQASARLQQSGAREVNRKLLLAEPGSELQSDLQKQLSGFVHGRLDTSPSWDSSSYTLMELVDWIPLEYLEIFDDKAWQGRLLPSSFYVWPAEQHAAKIEAACAETLDSDQTRRLSSRFVSWLAQDNDLVQLIGLGSCV